MCRLGCDPGYLPDLIPITTCVDGHYQPYRPEKFLCQPAVALLLSIEGEMEVIGEDARCNQIMPNIPIPSQSGLTLEMLDNQLIIGAFGVTNNSWNYIQHTDPRSNLLADLWTESTTLGSNAPIHHLSFVFGKDLVFLGGVSGSQMILQKRRTANGEWNALRLKWTNATNFNFLTQDACVVKVTKDEFIVLGGREAVSGRETSLVLMVNMKEQTVEELGSLIFARYLHACAVTSEPLVLDAVPSVLTNYILVTGGLGHSEIGSPVIDEIFDLSAKTSRTLAHSMKSARYDHTMLVLGHKTFAFGGRQQNNSLELNTIEIFNASTESWTLHSERLLSKATSGMASTALPLSAVACNQGCKCGVKGHARIIGGDNVRVRNWMKTTCSTSFVRLFHILGWAFFSSTEKQSQDTVDARLPWFDFLKTLP